MEFESTLVQSEISYKSGFGNWLYSNLGFGSYLDSFLQWYIWYKFKNVFFSEAV